MFDDLIEEIWSTTPGLENVLLSGIDGIVIAKHHEDESDEFLAAEAANLIKESQKFGQELNSGTLLSLCTSYDRLTVLVQMVTQEYFLIGIMKEAQNLGYIRYRFNLKSYEWYSAIT